MADELTEGTPTESETPPTETPVPDKMAKARAAKKNKAKTERAEDRVLATLIEQMANRITELERDKKDGLMEVEITSATPGAPHQPGSYVQVGPADRPNLIKVRWTRDDVERLFEMIDFTPEQGMTVTWNGLKYDLVRRKTVRVPVFVKELHDNEIFRQEHGNDAYRPVSLAEHANAAQRAMESPGTPIWTRLSIVGAGLDVGEQVEAEPAKAR